mmetsp:Transcript_25135/g.69088  ORF Transcript_25135/g.69088 Transcript_25135/m.69088 type:complete len:340 (-) Transcript_25135:163-1182(-)
MDSSRQGASVAAGVGAGLMLAKTLIIVIGLQLMSYASRIKHRTHRCQIKVLGMALAMAMGPLAEVAAYAFAPQSLLAPMNGFDLVWNVLLAPFTLGERQNRAKIVSTLVVFTGSCFAPMVGPHSVTAMSLEELHQNFLSTRFLVYAVVCLSCFLAGLAAVRRRKQRLRSPLHGKDVVRGTLIGVVGGFVSGQTYFLSASATLVRASIDGGNWSALLDWLPYVIIGGALMCGFVNAVLMAEGLAEFEAMFFVPMFAGSSIAAACIAATVVLRETIDLPWWRTACYWLGIVLVIVGLSILVKEARKTSAATSEPSVDCDSSASTGTSSPEESCREAESEDC